MSSTTTALGPTRTLLLPLPAMHKVHFTA